MKRNIAGSKKRPGRRTTTAEQWHKTIYTVYIYNSKKLVIVVNRSTSSVPVSPIIWSRLPGSACFASGVKRRKNIDTLWWYAKITAIVYTTVSVMSTHARSGSLLRSIQSFLKKRRNHSSERFDWLKTFQNLPLTDTPLNSSNRLLMRKKHSRSICAPSASFLITTKCKDAIKGRRCLRGNESRNERKASIFVSTSPWWLQINTAVALNAVSVFNSIVTGR